jgi:hypothetical protein
MLRSAASKVMWVGRATVFLVGLSVILALVVGVASTALAGTGVGAAFNLGKTNTVNAVSKLVGSTASTMLLVDNNGAGTALDLRVGASNTSPADKAVAPMQVDSQAKVVNLNADKLDGMDATQLGSTPQVEPWHEVGTAGEPAFESGYSNYQDPEITWTLNTAAFYRDPFEVVHLKGFAVVVPSSCSDAGGFISQTVFTLPVGYRPAAWERLPGGIVISPDGKVRNSCEANARNEARLDGVTFRVAN